MEGLIGENAMDIEEAYRRTLEAAEELRAAGIEVRIKKTRSKVAVEADRLPRNKWVIIVFHPKGKDEAAVIKKKADELGWAGIAFDTSGGMGERTWEVDWSLRVTSTPDGDWQARREKVEDMIDETGPGP